MIGRWLCPLTLGTIDRSSVLRVESSNVRIPRSQRITCAVALGQDVLGRHQQVLDRRAHAPLQQDRRPGPADLLEQVEVLHVPTLLAGVPAARLFDECLKLFLGGHAVAGFASLQEFDLLPHFLPSLAEELAREPDGEAARVLALGLAGTDERVRADRSVTPTFLFAVLLYGPIMRLAAERTDGSTTTT